MRLIDADELHDAILDTYGASNIIDVADVLEFICDSELIDSKNFMQRGKWIEDGQTTLTEDCFCSLCFWYDTFPRGYEKYKYCPNCGAKMDLEV